MILLADLVVSWSEVQMIWLSIDWGFWLSIDSRFKCGYQLM